MPHSPEAYQTILAAIEKDVACLRGSAKFEDLTRLELIEALVRYKQAGGPLPSGRRGTGKSQAQAAMLEYAQALKGTVRDAVAANPVAYHELLSNIIGGLKTEKLSDPAVFPKHEHLAKFLGHFITEDDIFGPSSPFNKKAWDEVLHGQARANIVRQAIRLAW
jgi:hypothetical protein